jgi:HK97 family phage prohead protease
MKRMELRTQSIDIRSNDDDSLTVSGYVNKTNQLSETLGAAKRFREKIEPGVFKRAIQRAKDIHFFAEHNKDRILASTKNGSLTLREDNQGLYMEATISPTSWGKDYYQLIKDGIISNMSFGFRTIADSWEKQGNENIRTIKDMDLFEVSAVRDPAYSQSSIAARSIEVDEVDVPEIEEEKRVVEKIEKPLAIRVSEQMRFVHSLREAKKVGMEVDKHLKQAEQELNKLMEEEKEMRKIEELEKEIRELQTLANNQSIKSEKVVDINDRLEAVSSAYSLAKKVYFAGTQLKLPYESKLDDATFVNENDPAPIIDLNLSGFADLAGTKRLAVSAAITKLALQEAYDGMSKYIEDLLIERIGTALQANVLAGDGVLGFRGISTDSNVSSSPITMNNVTIQQLRDLMKNVHSAALPDSSFYMNRTFFDRVADLKDANGKYYIKYEDGIPMLFGHVVEISDALTDDSASGNIPVIFGNISVGYTIGIKKDLEIKEITMDAKYALAGNCGWVADMLVDGAITNYQVLSVGKVA